MKKHLNKKGFTLIEIIVSVTILSIVVVSIFMIFIKSGEVNRQIDTGRLMQENAKNIIETISEDVRINGLNLSTGHHSFAPGEKYSTGSILYVGSNMYYLAKKNGPDRIYQSNSNCSSIKDNCYIVKNNGITPPSPLSNSWIQINNLDFYVSNDLEAKITLNITLQPASKKGLQSDIIKNNKIIIQTTLTERLYKDY